MKYLIIVVAVLSADSVNCQANIGLPPPPVVTPGAGRELDDGVRQDYYLPILEQLQEKMSADDMDFDDENSIEERKPAECVDLNEGCKRWADKGECFINPIHMLTHCKLSCKTCVDCAGGCGPGNCTGPNQCDCPSPYEQVGYTCLNPADFNNCLDYIIFCDKWAARERGCDSTIMKFFCKKACKLSPCT